MAKNYLPEDMIVEILHRVPPKPLVRFSTVSKRWHSIICADPQFKKSYVKLASEKQTLRRRLLFSPRTFPYQVGALDLETLSPSFGVRNVSCPFNKLFGYRFDLLGSCNGLVCVAFVDPVRSILIVRQPLLRSVRNLYIWNPSNGFFQKLDDPGFSHQTDAYSTVVYSALGHLSATDDYKIFVATGSIIEEGRNICSRWEMRKVNIFSLRCKLWKRIELPSYLSLQGRGTLCNESLHWMLYPSESRDIDIVAFDLAKEEFSRQIPLPDSLMQGRGGFVELGVYSAGCLCVMSSSSKDSIDLWVMTEYGVRDSWTKLFNFRITYPPCDTYVLVKSIMVTEEGTLSVLCSLVGCYDHKLVLKIY
ncbi:putative F-box domain-containing protein [Rosa chinensis]|uniref:Putative F-box domain-containing protein n=1 Tax=Rosa chinensis TaxID=74649 RepID=A0A2P6SNA2_ROSCH|nr:putative F-box domain-containing protein [Rosa chinensis]